MRLFISNMWPNRPLWLIRKVSQTECNSCDGAAGGCLLLRVTRGRYGPLGQRLGFDISPGPRSSSKRRLKQRLSLPSCVKTDHNNIDTLLIQYVIAACLDGATNGPSSNPTFPQYQTCNFFLFYFFNSSHQMVLCCTSDVKYVKSHPLIEHASLQTVYAMLPSKLNPSLG